MTRCAYIFLDESGNLDFGVRGTRYFILTAISTRRPFQWLEPLDGFKYDCIEYGLQEEYFHCSEDNRYVRGKVFGIIGSNLGDVRIDSLIVEKNELASELREDTRLYPEMLGSLLKSVSIREEYSGADSVMVITDAIPVNRRAQGY